MQECLEEHVAHLAQCQGGKCREVAEALRELAHFCVIVVSHTELRQAMQLRDAGVTIEWHASGSNAIDICAVNIRTRTCKKQAGSMSSGDHQAVASIDAIAW
jgi:hypothetical protein